MNSQRKLLKFGAIALFILILITLIVAPSSNPNHRGSTYRRTPDGYGAWYEFMQQEDANIQRWQKSSPPPFNEGDNPIVLVRIYSALFPQWQNSSTNTESSWLTRQDKEWVEQGNSLIILGWRKPPTRALFKTSHSTQLGMIEVETRRRAIDKKDILLGDDFGAIIWREPLGKGEVILATTPYLAANAYQDNLINYKFLSYLVRYPDAKIEKNKTIEFESRELDIPPRTIFVDEYIHGYKDRETIEEEETDGLLKYLARTPLFPALLQGSIIMIFTVFSLNRRWGKPQGLDVKNPDNSRAYIEALASVLQKAENHDFIVDLVGKEEQVQLQKKLGLDSKLLDEKTLVDAWIQQTGQPAKLLEEVMETRSRDRQLGIVQLLEWLRKWQEIHQRCDR
ncbi:MAG: DUF4350 domain-containing protein [Spirulina sp.]